MFRSQLYEHSLDCVMLLSTLVNLTLLSINIRLKGLDYSLGIPFLPFTGREGGLSVGPANEAVHDTRLGNVEW